MYSMNDATRKKARIVSDDMEAVSLKHRHPMSEIDGIENPNFQTVGLGPYLLSVDDNDNLLITRNDLLLCEYSTSDNDWKFGDISLKEVDATLENHYRALSKIKQVLKEAGLILINSELHSSGLSALSDVSINTENGN